MSQNLVQINPVYYQYLYDYQNRYELYWGGRGSGKSVFVMQKTIIKAVNERRRILVIRKYAAQLRETIFELALQQLSAFGIKHLCKINYSTFNITLPNGSCFIFKGLDDPEKLKSITDISDIIVEEASQIENEMDVVSLDQGLRANAPNLQMFLMFNPPFKTHWLFKRYFADGITLPPKTFTLKTTFKDNLFLNPESKAAYEQLKLTNLQEYERTINGEWVSLDKLIYTNWIEQDFDYKQIKGTSLVGLDFGYVADPTALIASIATSDKKIYVYDEHYQAGLLNNQIADILKYKGLSKEIIIADSAEQKSIAEIKQAGIYRIKPATKGPDSVIHGIQKLQQYQIIVHPRCANTIMELSNYSWIKDRSGEYTNTPSDSFNHLMDALRYSIQALEKQPHIVAISSPY